MSSPENSKQPTVMAAQPGTRMFHLPHLPWSVGALVPVISSRTLQFHHGCHHAAYVDAVNRAVAARPEIDGDTTIEIARWAAQRPDESVLRNNASQAWNHELQWRSLAPARLRPSGTLKFMLEREFGDYAKFANSFATAGTQHFGSGWLWLVLNESGRLAIRTTADADSPALAAQVCLLVIDLWEHAYYLDHQNRRREYLDAVIDRRLNWDFAQRSIADRDALTI